MYIFVRGLVSRVSKSLREMEVDSMPGLIAGVVGDRIKDVA